MQVSRGTLEGDFDRSHLFGLSVCLSVCLSEPPCLNLLSHHLCHLSPNTANAATSPAKNWSTVVSLIFLAISLTYTGWSTYQSIAGQELREEDAVTSINNDANLKKVLTGDTTAGGAKVTEGGASATRSSGAEDESSGAVPNLTSKDQAEASLIWIFHLLMALAGSYMAMSITNWGNPAGVPDASSGATVGTESMWLKIVAQWLTMILYAWSLWAPVC